MIVLLHDHYVEGRKIQFTVFRKETRSVLVLERHRVKKVVRATSYFGDPRAGEFADVPWENVRTDRDSSYKEIENELLWKEHPQCDSSSSTETP